MPLTASGGPSARPPVVAVLLPVVAALLAYSGGLGGGFVYDDLQAVAQSPAIASGDWWGAAFGQEHTPLANRPVVTLGFALDRAIWGMQAGGFRATNLLLHVGNVLLLLGVLRRALQAPNLGGRYGPDRATWIATAVALLWACHPLAADAVAYVTQRTTLLMSTALLAALYCVLRDFAAPARRWRILAVGALMLGMASKEELVAAPLLVPLFERALLLPSWRAARPRLPFYLALASSWLVLSACVSLGPSNPTVGFRSLVPVSPFEWLLSQAGVLVHYLRLVLWPQPLRGVYDWGIVREVPPALVPGAIVLVLLGVTAWLWSRRPALAWLGALFFLLLAPTSSVMPIVTEVVAERRMYLPMLAVLVPVVLLANAGVQALRRRGVPARSCAMLASGLALAVALACTLATRARVPVFTSEAAFWSDAFAKNELANRSLLSATILAGKAKVLREQGRADEALALLQRAMECERQLGQVRLNYAISLRDHGQLGDAERELRALLAEQPELAHALGALAQVLLDAFELDLAAGRAKADDARLREAEQLTRRAFALGPRVQWLSILGTVLCRRGRLVEAEEVLHAAIRRDPDFLDPYRNLGALLLLAGQTDDAVMIWKQLLPRLPTDVGLRMNLANALQQEHPADAEAMLQEVLRLQPGHAAATRLLQQLQQLQQRR